MVSVPLRREFELVKDSSFMIEHTCPNSFIIQTFLVQELLTRTFKMSQINYYMILAQNS